MKIFIYVLDLWFLSEPIAEMVPDAVEIGEPENCPIAQGIRETMEVIEYNF